MRPVQRGDVPADSNGNAVVFGQYKEARDLLIGRIGDFCSYCEVALHSTVHVEHVQPKSRHPGLALHWSNFLQGRDFPFAEGLVGAGRLPAERRHPGTECSIFPCGGTRPAPILMRVLAKPSQNTGTTDLPFTRC